MDTTSIPPPQGGGVSENKHFYAGEIVLMRSKRLSKEEVKRFYDLYGSSLPIDVWWSYIGRDYNHQIQYCKDSDDSGGYYMFHTKYIGSVKDGREVITQKNPNDIFGHKMYTVEWEAREGTLFPGEVNTRTQEHYPENLISVSKMTVLSKEEILEDVLAWANSRNQAENNNLEFAI